MLLLALLSLWALTAVVMLGVCRSAALADSTLAEHCDRAQSAHWGWLER